MKNNILDSREVQRITLLSLSTITRLEGQGKFPRRRVLSRRRVGWLEKEISEWIESRFEPCSPKSEQEVLLSASQFEEVQQKCTFQHPDISIS